MKSQFMKSFFNSIIILFIISLNFSCFEDNDDSTTLSVDIKDFVWKGMNYVYLYKDDIPNLANNRFVTDSEYQSYLADYDSPENLFESLIYDPTVVDRFSWITSNYIALEEQFSGVTKTNGAEFNFYRTPGSTTEVFGIVRLILPGSNSSNTSLTRGTIFNKIDGQALNTTNLATLLSPDSYSLGIASYNSNGTDDPADDSLNDSDETITLTKTVYSENPIFKSEVINVNNENVGYLMYNGFVADYDTQLNAVFADFAAQNIQHLVLDLRYNPGGSVNSAAALGSMITGLSEGIFAKLQYNSELQNNNNDYNFTSALAQGEAINALNLNKVYVLTSGSSASASEMIINSLNPYIEVVQIGTKTVGKSQASITIYDSPNNFQRSEANPGHLYALQPLVAITVNKDNEVVPSAGITPTIQVKEKVENYGVLGASDEPLLAAALAAIQGGRFMFDFPGKLPILNSDSFVPHTQIMYLD